MQQMQNAPKSKLKGEALVVVRSNPGDNLWDTAGCLGTRKDIRLLYHCGYCLAETN